MEFAGYALWDAVNRFAIPGRHDMFSLTNTVLIFQAEKLFKKTAQINTGTLSEKGSWGHNLTFSRHFIKNLFWDNYLQLHDCYEIIFLPLVLYIPFRPFALKSNYFIPLLSHGGCHREDRLRGRKIK